MGGEGCFLTLNRPAHGLLGKRVHEESMAINCARPLLLFFFSSSSRVRLWTAPPALSWKSTSFHRFPLSSRLVVQSRYGEVGRLCRDIEALPAVAARSPPPGYPLEGYF